jgi:hypothetical protein
MMSFEWFPIEREYLVPHDRNMIKKDADWNPRPDGTPLLRRTVVTNLDGLGRPYREVAFLETPSAQAQ